MQQAHIEEIPSENHIFNILSVPFINIVHLTWPKQARPNGLSYQIEEQKWYFDLQWKRVDGSCVVLTEYAMLASGYDSHNVITWFSAWHPQRISSVEESWMLFTQWIPVQRVFLSFLSQVVPKSFPPFNSYKYHARPKYFESSSVSATIPLPLNPTLKSARYIA